MNRREFLKFLASLGAVATVRSKPLVNLKRPPKLEGHVPSYFLCATPLDDATIDNLARLAYMPGLCDFWPME